jgi:hypothetical protein
MHVPIDPWELEEKKEFNNWSEFELMVIEDMWRQGFHYPFITVDEVKAFWARKGIE